MAKLTSKNRRELRILSHYTPEPLRHVSVDLESALLYFDWSDRGKGRPVIDTLLSEEYRTRAWTGLSVLFYAKRYRDYAITTYLEDWEITCFPADFAIEPREVAEFVAKATGKPEVMHLWSEQNPSEPRAAAL